MNAIQNIKNYLNAETIRTRFAEIIGKKNAAAHISSVLLAVANDKTGKLAECTPKSIYISALRAASMRLSVDPASKQAYLVPFKNQATLVVGYKGLYDMAVRTNKYRYINVGKIFDGMQVEENPITGLHTITGQKKSDQVIGWIGAFEMLNGFAKTVYMTVEEIHEHAKKYSKMYSNPDGAWKTNTSAMEQKTVLRLLLSRWGYLDPNDVQLMRQTEDDIDDADNVIDMPAAVDEPVDAAEPEHSEEEILAQLGFEQ